MSRWLPSVLFCLLTVACVTAPPPNDDYNLAHVAIEFARAVEAPRHSPGFFNQAEEFYRKAKFFYEERDYISAKKEFIKARKAAEKSENSARLIRMKNGEVL